MVFCVSNQSYKRPVYLKSINNVKYGSKSTGHS